MQVLPCVMSACGRDSKIILECQVHATPAIHSRGGYVVEVGEWFDLAEVDRADCARPGGGTAIQACLSFPKTGVWDHGTVPEFLGLLINPLSAVGGS